MNKARRKRLDNVVEELQVILEEEEEAWDNLPENFQYSERGDTMQENIGQIQSAIDEIEMIE